jgi:hypothetical protein
MGYEILTQPQIFTKRLTAVGGIEGYIPPFIAKFHTWTISVTSNETTFDIPQDFVGLTHAPDDAYIVNINGLIIPPPEFTVDYNFRKLILNTPASSGDKINLTQIGTIALSTANYAELTGTKFFSQDSLITNLTSNSAIINNLRVNNKITHPLNVSLLSADNIIVDVDTINEAVRITQRGTGDVIRLEDSANPDASPFIVKSNGDVGIGFTNPAQKLHVDGNIRATNNIISDNGIFSNNEIDDYFFINPTDDSFSFYSNLKLKVKINGSFEPPKIIQNSDGNLSPFLEQNLSTNYVDTIAGIKIVDTVNPLIVPNGNSHSMVFDRLLPIRTVHYWYTSTPLPTSEFILDGNNILQSASEAYIVTVGSVIQSEDVYTINTSNRRITFTSNVPANTPVYVLQTVNPLLSAGYDIEAPTQTSSTITPSILTVPLTGLDEPWYSLQSMYLVSINGVYQIPESSIYTITLATSTLDFQGPIPSTFLSTVTRLPSAISYNAPYFDEACFLATSYTWTFSTVSPTNFHNLVGGPNDLLIDNACYLVNIGGVLQVPTSYSIDVLNRRINYSQTIPAGIDISVTQLAHPQFPIRYSTTFNLVDDCTTTSTGDAEEVLKLQPGKASVQGAIATAPPITVTTTTFNIPFSGSSIIFNTLSDCTVTLPAPERNIGRWLYVKNIASQTINSDLTNIIPLTSNTPTATILTNTIGKWAQLQSNGSQWVVMAGN